MMARAAVRTVAVLVLGVSVFTGCGESLEMEQHFHDSGALYMEGGTKDGARHGLWKSYYETGETWSVLSFKNGLKHGESRVYYQSGVLRMEGQFEEGARTEGWRFYDEEGREVESSVPQ